MDNPAVETAGFKMIDVSRAPILSTKFRTEIKKPCLNESNAAFLLIFSQNTEGVFFRIIVFSQTTIARPKAAWLASLL